MNSIALAKIGWHYYLGATPPSLALRQPAHHLLSKVYTVILVITGILMYFIIVETRGYTLEE